MTKLDLNDKLAALYGLESSTMTDYDIYGNDFEFLLIDDSARMFDLMIEHDLRIRRLDESAEIFYYSFDEEEQEGRWIRVIAKYTDHESKVAAARYAIAMALVKLAESKC